MAVVIKLKHISPLHMGTGKENYDFSSSVLQSDTISAALAAMRVQCGKVDDLKDFMESFTVSSAFPFFGQCLFFPKPQGKMNVSVSDMEEYPSRKKLKKVKFVEYETWKQLICGESVNVQSNQLQSIFLLSSKSVSEFAVPYKSQVNQRVSVPRNDGADADPFFFDWTYFHQEGGLFCVLDAPKNMETEIVELFQMLGETGIGTDKNIGGGKFEVEKSASINFDCVKSANATMLLSLYIPAEEEIDSLDLLNSKYELVQRGGFLAGSQEEDFKHLRKKSVYAFNVGSVFPTTTKLTGKIVDLQPSWNDERMHPVYRSGKPFAIPINLN